MTATPPVPADAPPERSTDAALLLDLARLMPDRIAARLAAIAKRIDA